MKNFTDWKFTDKIAELEKECAEKQKEIDFLEAQNKIFSKRLDVFEKNNLYENFDCQSVVYNDHEGTEFTVDNLINAYRNIEEENERLRKSYDRHKRKICELESELSAKENLHKTENGICEESELSGLTPIEVAEKLINVESEYETNSIQRAFGADEKEKYNIFSVSELRQIAEHLLVYCNHNSENKVCK